MSYLSIDILQKVLSEQVFSHTKDAKKAAGRALGTMIEIISFYLLREWGVEDSISIERGLPEYGNPSVTHNVEFTMHPLLKCQDILLTNKLPLTSSKIAKGLDLGSEFKIKNNTLLDTNFTLKNACNIAESTTTLVQASILYTKDNTTSVRVYFQHKKPYAMFECKRVGVEEGNKKGPQTIEKAKQGAYVAQNTSALQKIRNEKGEKFGIIYDNDTPIIKPYSELLHAIINGNHAELLKDFTMSVGIVSNHGNWFTSEDQNKELKVLAQSYDWLLFLSDFGLAQFITDLLLSPETTQYKPVREAFLRSYKEGKKSNIFTKVKMDLKAHLALCHYFHTHIIEIEKWFNVITPQTSSITTLKEELYSLKNKNWEGIL